LDNSNLVLTCDIEVITVVCQDYGLLGCDLV